MSEKEKDKWDKFEIRSNFLGSVVLVAIPIVIGYGANNISQSIQKGQLVQTVRLEVGKKYDFKSILTQALSGSFPGRFLDRLLRGKLEDKLAEIFNDPNKWICSELAAYALDEQPEYKDQGILKRPNATISPQELFEDSVIFELWQDGEVTECSDGHTHC